MNSNAKQIREQFKKLLNAGQPHSRTELFLFAQSEKEGEQYTDGMLAGA